MAPSLKNTFLIIALLLIQVGIAHAQTVKTPYGILSVSNQGDLILNQKIFSPQINGGTGIDFRFSSKYGDKFAVLLALETGGRACPSVYQWVLLSEKGFEASPEFGNCSEEVKTSLAGSELIVQAPKYGSAPAATYTFNGKQLKENDKMVKGKIVVGAYESQKAPSVSKMNSLPPSGGAYVAPESKLLKCGVNVNCQNKSEVIEKMRAAWLKLRNAGGGAVASYADQCYDAFKRIEKWNAAILIDAGIIEPQLAPCNYGLRELR
jgi:hypothetical protein